MYAVIETGGKQYRVAPGQEVEVDKLEGDIGAAVEFGRVLAVSNDAGSLLTGSDVSNAKVKGSIAAQGRGDKILVFKFKRKKQYKRTIGHRSYLTTVKIDEIVA